MIFLSVERSPEWVMKPGSFRIVETSMGAMPELVDGIRVRFTKLDDFLDTNLLPEKRGRKVARGILETGSMSKSLGVDEAVLIEFLTTRREYGIDMIGVSPDGDEEADDDDRYIVPVGDEYLCRLCDRTFKAQGRGGHVRSKAHKAALEAQEDFAQDGREAMEAAAGLVEEDSLASSMQLEQAQRDTA